MKKLAEQINTLNEGLAEQLPVEILEIFGRSIADLQAQKYKENSILVGQTFPEFRLPNTNNEDIALKDILKSGKVIIAFFRGSWCPYCNLELKALQENLKAITDRKATLVAISPQTIAHNVSMKTDCQLEYELLTDKDNILAKDIGISFALQEYVIPTYQGLGIDLSLYNGNSTNELPMPAVFLLDTDGTILYKFVEENYMQRVDIEELIGNL
ncbi:peroxiredoxin-like family protein [Sphingobacterium tabacisoli]|uniref:thioredoxin-dependent peroxiredoxin n=1 Tax=Sphingobacterium tabacisoli TaxID=2044855 RepID=A0ABW5L7D6_9SPHI|nr:peroxiredoxin-like family protein [Sphingobacterium tabacisoli]